MRRGLASVRTITLKDGALGGRSHLLRYQQVRKIYQTIRCISNPKVPFKKSALGAARPVAFSTERPVPTARLVSRPVVVLRSFEELPPRTRAWWGVPCFERGADGVALT